MPQKMINIKIPSHGTTSFQKRAVMGGSKKRKPRGRLPARFNQSQKRYNKNRNLSKAIAQLAETKLIPLAPVNELGGIHTHTGSLTYYRGFVLDEVPTGWDTNLVPLAGIQTALGVSGTGERVGNYIYFKKTHFTIQLDMNFITSARAPVEFRMVVCKSRQAVMPAGFTDVPQTTLFLNNSGSPVGYQTSGLTGMDLMNQPLNKRDWVVYKDRRFTMSHPMRTDSDGGEVGYSGKYPNRKTLHINLPFWKKTRIGISTNKPEDLDTHFLVYFFASAIGKDMGADSWEVSTRGTTSYNDV